AHPLRADHLADRGSAGWDGGRPAARHRHRGDAHRDVHARERDERRPHGMHLIAKRRTVPAADASARPTRGSSGQILVLFTLSVVVLIGFAAVAVDLGSLLKVRRDYQNAADAAALAGAPFLASTTPDRLSARHAAWNSLVAQLGITVAGTPWT